MGEVTIRKAEPQDADALGQCLEAAYAAYAERIHDLPRMSEGCAEEIASHPVWVAERGGAIIGGLVLIPSDGFMLLANVAVHPDGRGAGIGRSLLMLAESEAANRGYSEMRLNTHAALGDTIALYARSGWTETGRKGNTVSMRKELAP